MTYRQTARHANFYRRTGSSSQTGFGNAWANGGDPIAILPDCKAQYLQWQRAAREAHDAMGKTAGAEREAARQRLADALRHLGDLRRILQDGSRLAFEKVFCSVAQYRLPKDTFLVLVEEAREIWRSEGYHEMLPPMSKRDRQRAQKTETRRAMIAAGAHFES